MTAEPGGEQAVDATGGLRPGETPAFLAVPDKFRGTATAREIAEAACRGAQLAGFATVALPLSDGGEGLGEAIGGEVRETVTTGPGGEPVVAPWRLTMRDGRLLAVIEAAAASGLTLAGGREANDPIAASTKGTGELIAAAIEAGAQQIIVGCGGSATTDGGLGAIEALGMTPLRPGVELVAAYDTTTRFLDAARVFAPQKGASPGDVVRLGERLAELARRYAELFSTDVTTLPGGGAAGGLAGGLAAIGASLVSGFELVAGLVGLDAAIDAAHVVLTGEGRLDVTSFSGKVVGGVLRHALPRVRPLVVVGEIGDRRLRIPNVEVVSLLERYGAKRSMAEPAALVAEVVTEALGGLATETNKV